MSGEWWRESVVYQVYVRSFTDSDGDGDGDLAGVRARIPYLAGLGVDAVWLTPFYPSPLADGGYDVADYRGVDPRFGTLADLDALLADAHAAGLRVIVDIVPNHCSDQHPWFQAALAAGPGSPERARFLFRPGRGRGGSRPPNDWQAQFGGAAWTRVPDGEWYLHLFTPEQPDFDWTNPEVVAEFESVLRFWLDRGVDGFRIDVAHGLRKQEGLPDAGPLVGANILDPACPPLPMWDRDEVHEVYRGWRRVLDSYDGDRMTVGEVWLGNIHRLALYTRPDELHQAFNFRWLFAPWDADAVRAVIDASLGEVAALGAPTTWVLSNHDVYRPVTRYAHPAAPATGLARARAATLLQLALPGVAYLYQGEELGLPEVTDLPESALQDPIWERSGHTARGRDGCRVPIPWSGHESPFGFGPPGTKPWLPQPAAWAQLSVAAQQDDPASTLTLVRRALHLRRELFGGLGEVRWLDTPDDDVLVLARDGAGGAPGVVCAVNLGSAEVPLPDGPYGTVLLASGPLPDHAALPASTTVWYRLDG